MSSTAFDIDIECSSPMKKKSGASYYLGYVKRSPIMCGLATLVVVGLLLLLLKPAFVKDDDDAVLHSRIIIYSLIAGIIISILHHKFY